MKILIITGGGFDLTVAKELVNQGSLCEYDYCIAADRGVKYCFDLGITPDYCIGDFDSFEGGFEGVKAMYSGELKRYPCEKDDTDTHLALNAAIELKATEIDILGATGTRLDHVLANINILYVAYKAGVVARIIDGNNVISIMEDRALFAKNECFGKYFSIIPYTEKCEGVTLKGFKYNLSDGIIERASSLGVSNEVVEDFAEITIKSGTAIIIQSRD